MLIHTNYTNDLSIRIISIHSYIGIALASTGEMRERPIRFRHFVNVLFFLYCRAVVL